MPAILAVCGAVAHNQQERWTLLAAVLVYKSSSRHRGALLRPPHRNHLSVLVYFVEPNINHTTSVMMTLRSFARPLLLLLLLFLEVPRSIYYSEDLCLSLLVAVAWYFEVSFTVMMLLLLLCC